MKNFRKNSVIGFILFSASLFMSFDSFAWHGGGWHGGGWGRHGGGWHGGGWHGGGWHGGGWGWHHRGWSGGRGWGWRHRGWYVRGRCPLVRVCGYHGCSLRRHCYRSRYWVY